MIFKSLGKIFPLFFFVSIATCYGATFIEDQSNLPWLSPDLKEREMAKIRLDNGLELLLIHDPKADQSAASFSVQYGSWSDPQEFPGMAHFCEHMLFMGTHTYPETNDFFSLVADFDGKTNAFTSPDQTVYMFSSRTEGFLPLFDRFAHFFMDPLFDMGNISRELHAVDQEFQLQKEHDGWRTYMVFKETGNPDHPNRAFSTGNAQTLGHIPKEALQKWHAAHYRPDAIKGVIYSSLPLEELIQVTISTLEAIPSPKKGKIPRPHLLLPLTSAEQKGHWISIAPIRNQEILSLTWELPLELSHEPTQSAELVAYALERGAPSSLGHLLKKEKLIDSLSIDLSLQGKPATALFEMTFELSSQGAQNPSLVIEKTFAALKSLQKEGLSLDLFEEKNHLKALGYQYQNREDPFHFITFLGRTIGKEPLETYPKELLLGANYSKETIDQVFEALLPKDCIVMQISSVSPKSYDKQEEWLKVPYRIDPIPASLLQKWEMTPPHPEIHAKELNPFVPQKLEIVEDDSKKTLPLQIADSPQGKAYYARLSEFNAPEASIHLQIHSEALQPTAQSEVLASLYLDHLTDLLSPTLSFAKAAGLQTQFSIEKQTIHLTLNGFSEKEPLLLQEILSQMNPRPPTKEEFTLYVNRHKKEFANGAKELPARQAKELFVSLVLQETFTKQDKLAAIEEISYEEFLLFQEKLFKKTFFEALFAGNLSLKTAESSWIDILHSLAQSPFSLDEKPSLKALPLSSMEGPVVLRQQTSAQGHAAFLLLDQGSFSFEKRGAQEILASALGEAFFHTLRTKQKTGYIARAEEIEVKKQLYQTFLVQSNSHEPEDLLHRFELFLEEYLQDFSSNISQERFDLLKQSAISSLQTRFRSLSMKAALLNKLAFQEKGDFLFVEKRIDALQQLSYGRFQEIAFEFLARTNRKRLAILFEGKVSSPFAYQPISFKELEHIASYESAQSP